MQLSLSFIYNRFTTIEESMKKKVFLIGSDSFGRGDEKLGSILASNFFRILGEHEELPESMFFWNNGVKLVCQGSDKIELLRDLEQKGVMLMVCKTCLDYFGLIDKVTVGKVAGMPTLIELATNFEIVSL